MWREQDTRERTLAMVIVCCSVLMVVLDTTAVTVALPSIATDLRTGGTSLTWVINAYTITFGGLLLLSGRLGDIFGERRMFLVGIGVFAVSSAVCGLADALSWVLIARATQGLGGALVTAVSLSLITKLYDDESMRTNAMAIYGLVCGAGGGIGQLVGGFVTHELSWHWIFLINVPVGAVVFGFSCVFIPHDAHSRADGRLDIAGAGIITIALTTAVYALVNQSEVGWLSVQTVGLLGIAAILVTLFIYLEARLPIPLIPLRLFHSRDFVTANVLAFLWAAGAIASYVTAAFYLQRVLHYNALQVGLAFAPGDAVMATFSAGLAARLVTRFGVRFPLWSGLSLVAVGLSLLSRAPIRGVFLVDVLPGMLLMGIGAGMASTPLLLAAMNNISNQETGVASGIVNASFLIGGALSLGLLASLADARTVALERSGVESVLALNGGYHVAFTVGALLTGAAAVVGALRLRVRTPS